MIGKTISHYKILEKLGEGGMGVVYKAEDTKLKRTVALKFLPREYSSDIAAKERFIHEAQAASALDHPNICTIYEIGETKPALGEPGDSQSYIAMACYEGQSLKSKIDNSQLTIEESIDITIQIAKGLKRAHEAGIVHRDIKPANIIVTEHDEVKILDFGLAKLAGQTRLTKEGMTVGTIAYMSPEQAHGEQVDHRSDIWSLGVILYEMLAGQLPFRGEYEQAIIYSIINEEPEKISELINDMPQELDKIISKCLSKNPEHRYQTIEELLIDFKPFSSEAAISVDESILGILKRLWRKRIIRRVSVTASILVTLVIMYIIFWPKITEPIPIAVISFENQTGDESNNRLSKIIPNLLITNLEQSGRFQVTTWPRLQDLLKQLGKKDVEFIDSDLGFQLCIMEGIPNIAMGTITKIGNIFATDLKILDVKTKEIVQTAQSRGEGDNSIFEQIDNLTRDITTQFAGFSEEQYASTHNPIMEVTTASIEAYNYFLKGREENEKWQYNDAVKFLEKAVELDTTFAMAYCYLGESYFLNGEFQLCKKPFEKAKSYADKVTDKERLYIEYYEVAYTTHDYEKKFRLAEQLVKKYPREKRFHISLGIHLGNRDIDASISEFKKVIELDPYYGPAYNNLAYRYLWDMEDYDQALEYAKKYAQVSPGNANPHDTMGDIYFVMGDLNQAIAKYEETLFIKPDFGTGLKLACAYALQENYNEVMKSLNNHINIQIGVGKSNGYIYKAFYNAWQGCFKQSLKDIEEAIKIDYTMGNKFFAAMDSQVMAYIHYESGNIEISRQVYNNFHDLDIKEDLTGDTAYIKANYYIGLVRLDLRQGKLNSVKSKMKQIETHLPHISEWLKDRVNYHSQMLFAEVLLAENKMEEAITTYKKILPHNAPYHIVSYNIPFTRDVVARAYIKQGDLNKAISEYERLITFDPKSKDRRLIHPKYHYRLAKLYQETDQLDKAIKEYEKFLDIWKNADKDQPDLIDAKKRLANLSGKK